MKVILSVGHNNAKNNWYSVYRDKGASYNGETEYSIVSKLVDLVMIQGIPGVQLLRVPDQLNLPQRIKWINSNPCDYCLEFHLDSASLTATGCQTWYYSGSEEAKKKAVKFQMGYTEVTGLPGRGVKGDKENRHGQLGFIRQTNPLALLVELGFITNRNDVAKINTKGVQGIIKGILNLKS